MQGLHELTHHAGVKSQAKPPLVAAAVDFILEGLYAQKKITRSDEWHYQGAEPPRARPPATAAARVRCSSATCRWPGNKKKYYN